ncbi:LysR substrate-binding domain-containing protein [Ramlibacter sp.]|uniref:LysR substrate-binding domain-containing protein n=1 Tax=Ramlibacter sp. TaxID=1917967 RepID=UPI003D0A7957
MNLRHLRYFIAVASELSFTRAAETLHIAQPPLSQQIKLLEDDLGVKLFRRTKRRVELTEAGSAFLVHAKQIMQMTHTAALEAQRAGRGEAGRIAVGFFEHMSYSLLPPIYRAYRKRFPGVDVELRWFPVVEQADALRRGDIDVAFMREIGGQADMSHQLLMREPLVLALPASHPLAAKQRLSVKDCAQERFVMFVPHMAPDLHAAISRMFAVAKVAPKVAVEVVQISTCLGLVSFGAGLALVPSTVQRMAMQDVVYRPIGGSRPPTINVLLGWQQRKESLLLTSFVETAMQVVRQLVK